MTVLQYANTFHQLAQYAGYHVDTDAKKQACFRRGLSSKLQDRLAVVRSANFNELVDLAITQEDRMMAHKADKKRKAPVGQSSSSAPKYCLVQSTQHRAKMQQS